MYYEYIFTDIKIYVTSISVNALNCSVVQIYNYKYTMSAYPSVCIYVYIDIYIQTLCFLRSMHKYICFYFSTQLYQSSL